MKRLLASLPVVVLAVLAPLFAPAPAHAATFRLVVPGQSIQAVLDAASPGDTVVIRPGTYRENIEITKDHITVRGAGARLEAPATPTPRRCSTTFGFPDTENPYGICVAGDIDPVTFAITRPVTGVTIEGLTVGLYEQSGIIVFGGQGTTIRHTDVAGGPGDRGYSILVARSSRSRVLGNRVHGAGGAGIYIGSSPQAEATIKGNVAVNSGSFGIMVRDSAGGTVEDNRTFANCMGIGFVDGGSDGTASDWSVHDNTVQRNTAVCPGSNGDPDVSGVGILLAGAERINVHHNYIAGNSSGSVRAPYAGGVVLASGALFGGTRLAGDNSVIRNTIIDNRPFDLNLVDVAPGNVFHRNRCGTASRSGLCERH